MRQTHRRYWSQPAWNEHTNAIAQENGGWEYPAWGHDFISIHDSRDAYPSAPFSLVSPLCIVYANPNQDRPEFEHERFRLFGEAKARALALAKQHTNGRFIYVVDCSKPYK